MFGDPGSGGAGERRSGQRTVWGLTAPGCAPRAKLKRLDFIIGRREWWKDFFLGGGVDIHLFHKN